MSVSLRVTVTWANPQVTHTNPLWGYFTLDDVPQFKLPSKVVTPLLVLKGSFLCWIQSAELPSQLARVQSLASKGQCEASLIGQQWPTPGYS